MACRFARISRDRSLCVFMRRESWLIALPAMGVVLAQIAFTNLLIYQKTGGVQSYPLDDAYIHLAIAKNLAVHGSYGVSPGVFSPAASSLLWPLLLAAFGVVTGAGMWPSLPLALNSAFACASCVVLAKCVSLTPRRRARKMLLVLLISLLSPLASLAHLGMEHVLHLCLTLAFTFAVTRHASLRVLAMLAFLLTAVRYEGLFLVLASLIVFAQRRAFRDLFAVLLCGLLPVAIFAVVCKLHGEYLLPLPVLMKLRAGASLPLMDRVVNALTRMQEAPHYVALLLATGLLYLGMRKSCTHQTRTFAELALGAGGLHLVLGTFGWFYRYETYAVALLLTACARMLQHGKRCAVLLAAVALSLPNVLLVRRALHAAFATPLAAQNIHLQQRQMARFFAESFSSDSVAVNDIGAVAFFRPGPLVDLMGLSNRSVAEARGLRIDGSLSANAVQTLTQNAPVAILYDEWFQGAVPSTWTKVGAWTVPNNRSCAFPTVAVYATSPESLARVKAAWTSFVLPPVVQRVDW
jgi:hypothetical protein